ncbi:transcriptional regulator [Marinihelvus fidelis]|uniref:Transcriptional regulator n=1 Tax=Marinihelvus fidelis TaxID=2613842 RepID=A0A5N0T3W6_9GAMM|nr:transcriptional regulator [Marinihelvus fidelis]KAA9129760.1 transcriptional regulator [Marinihelvus fidelis]
MDETTLKIGVRTMDKFFEGVAESVENVGYTTPSLYFPSAEDLFKTLGGRRWEILQALAGQRSVGVRELARLVAREVKSVHRDTEALVAGGVISKADDGKLSFPYTRIVLEPFEFESGRAA